MQKLAVFGGTFNPIHWGHLWVADAALRQQAIDRILWLPTAAPPHKRCTGLADYRDRLTMVRQAIAPYPLFCCCDLEGHTNSSYAADTQRYLEASYPNRQWFWLIGSDAFQSLPRWYRRQDWIDRCGWLVAPRGSDALAACQQTADRLQQEGIALSWQLLALPPIDLSSSLVRQSCQAGRSLQGLVPDRVAEYIAQHQLYQNG